MTLELRFTIPGQVERTVALDQPALKVGALLSNQIVLRAPNVDPIHALIEETDPGQFVVTDLGSAIGIKVNGSEIDVEHTLSAGDVITIGSVDLTVVDMEEAVPGPPPVPGAGASDRTAATAPISGTAIPPTQPEATAAGGMAKTVASDDDGAAAATDKNVGATRKSPPPQAKVGRAEGRKKDQLFSPRKAKPTGDVLEVVAYWGDTVLETELFHDTYKGFEEVTIGDPTKAHLISAGKSHFDRFTLAKVGTDGFKIYMRDGMKARLRKSGKVGKVEGKGKHSLGRRDIAHIKYGAVSYFLMFVRPPALNLPRSGIRDPLLLGLSCAAALFYLGLMPLAWLHTPKKVEEEKDDIWSIVQVPEKDKKIEKAKPKPKPKPKQKIAKKKVKPKKPKPPKPKPPKPKPAKPVEKKKVTQPKPVKKPVPTPKPTKVLTQNTTKQPKRPNPNKKVNTQARSGPKSPTTNPNKAPGPKSKNNRPKTNNKSSAGTPSTGAKNPNFKLAGPKTNAKLGKSGGPKGGGLNQLGGAIKGKGKASVRGVEGVKNNKASGVNLSKLGLGVGKIINKKGAGAINTRFKNSAGGAGGGMGSASKTYGLGGVGSGKSLGLAGGGGANNFGSGSGGFGSGLGGSGGYGGSGGGSGIGSAFGGGGGGGGGGGRGRANVSVPPGDPVVSGGLTPQEILAVIRANLNQIRHCYEQTLQRSPNASGKMSVRFVVATSGRVQTVNVTSSTVSDSRMRSCVTGKIRRWKFPRPRGGQPVTVNYPFVFNPL